MFCNKCGAYLPEGTQFCSSCGAAQNDFGTPGRTTPKRSVSFVDAIQMFFSRFFDFSGRSRRSEYWYAMLFCNIISFVIGAVVGDLAGIWSLVIFIPTLAVSIRRLHDTGKSGWWYLIMLIPLVGPIILLVLFCQDSQRANKWGRSPKY